MLRFPILSGACSYSMKLVMFNNGTLMSNDGGFVLALAHLCKAARHYGLLKVEWHDFDWLPAQHGRKPPLVTKVHAKADHDALLRHFLMAFGVPASKFSRQPRPALPSRSKTTIGSRPINVTSDYHEAMCAQHASDDKSGFSQGNAIDAVLRQLSSKETPAVTAGCSKTTKRSAKPLVEVTPLQLLSLFKRELIADDPELNFNYAGFFQLCAGMLLDAVKHAVIDFLPDPDVRPCHIRCGYDLIHFLLLDDAAETSARSEPIVTSLLGPAAAAMQTVIEKEGKKFTQDAYDQSSGRILKHLRPQFTPRETGPMHVQGRATFEARGMKLGTRINAPIYDPTSTMED